MLKKNYKMTKMIKLNINVKSFHVKYITSIDSGEVSE